MKHEAEAIPSRSPLVRPSGFLARKAEALGVICAALLLVSAVALARAPDPKAAFMHEMGLAMNRMMAGMDPRPAWAKLWPLCIGGSVDENFVAMMVPHHQGAIDMAIAELKYGNNPQLKRIAQEIIVDQQQEIAAMHLAVGQPLPPSKPAPTITATSARPQDFHQSNTGGN